MTNVSHVPAQITVEDHERQFIGEWKVPHHNTVMRSLWIWESKWFYFYKRLFFHNLTLEAEEEVYNFYAQCLIGERREFLIQFQIYYSSSPSPLIYVFSQQFQWKLSTWRMLCSITTGVSYLPWMGILSRPSPGFTTAKNSRSQNSHTFSLCLTRLMDQWSTVVFTSTSPPTSTMATTLWLFRTNWGGMRPQPMGCLWIIHSARLIPKAKFWVSSWSSFAAPIIYFFIYFNDLQGDIIQWLVAFETIAWARSSVCVANRIQDKCCSRWKG